MYCSTVQAIGSKRPTSDRSQPAGGKKVCTRAGGTPRQEHLDKIFSQLALDKDDKQASKCLVDNTLKKLLRREVIFGNGDQIYSNQPKYAGSYPVKTKIGKADEFDVIIPLNINYEKVRRRGKVRYSYRDENLSDNQNFDRNRCLSYDPDGKSIPNGYAVVDVNMESSFPRNPVTGRREVPPCFLHEPLKIPTELFSSCCLMSINESFGLNHNSSRLYGFTDNFKEILNRSETSHGCIELIPWDVKRCLYFKLFNNMVFSSQWRHRGLNTDVSHISHGPALTITIVPGGIAGITHRISLDITPSLECDIHVSEFGWPREETRKAFREKDINEAIKAGTHLVPKKDLFWAISFSKAEKKLLKNIDYDQGCRKYVTKLLKKFVQTCRSQSQNGLPGISSHIIKTQVLWSCEKHCNDRIYWHWDNRDSCLITTMKELEGALRNRRLSDYFNPKLNILKGKEDSVLDQLAGLISRERKFLMKF